MAGEPLHDAVARAPRRAAHHHRRDFEPVRRLPASRPRHRRGGAARRAHRICERHGGTRREGWGQRLCTRALADVAQGEEQDHPRGERTTRSEEHTAELQSLMSISYAFFCLKTKQSLKYLKST